MNYKIYIAAISTVLLAACANDFEEYTGPVEAKITAGLDEVATRTDGTNWNADEIGVFVTLSTSGMDTKYTNVKYTTTTTGSTSATFTAADGGIFFEDASETVTFAAYAPYNASAMDNGISVETKDNNTIANIGNIDCLYAPGTTASRSNPSVTFTFKHVMSRLKFTITPSTSAGFTSGTTPTSVKLSGLKHTGTFTPRTGTVAETSGATAVSNWDITSNYSSLIVIPQTVAELTLAIEIDSKTYSAKITPDLEASKSYNYTISVEKDGLTIGESKIEDWTSEDQSATATMPK